MTYPWMQFYTRDWLDSKELRRCSPAAPGLLVDLMAIAHEGYPYGYLADKVGALKDEYLSCRCVIQVDTFRLLMAELVETGRIAFADDIECVYVPRMVDDNEAKRKKSEAGKKGGK